ncbi:hypothetical protein FAI40_01525 [Acetobacteraceae bacterium]|nr:hypothetical protein FAI40_01525 [Acetobacteraceae bacterium]
MPFSFKMLKKNMSLLGLLSVGSFLFLPACHHTVQHLVLGMDEYESTPGGLYLSQSALADVTKAFSILEEHLNNCTETGLPTEDESACYNRSWRVWGKDMHVSEIEMEPILIANDEVPRAVDSGEITKAAGASKMLEAYSKVRQVIVDRYLSQGLNSGLLLAAANCQTPYRQNGKWRIKCGSLVWDAGIVNLPSKI